MKQISKIVRSSKLYVAITYNDKSIEFKRAKELYEKCLTDPVSEETEVIYNYFINESEQPYNKVWINDLTKKYNAKKKLNQVD